MSQNVDKDVGFRAGAAGVWQTTRELRSTLADNSASDRRGTLISVPLNQLPHRAATRTKVIKSTLGQIPADKFNEQRFEVCGDSSRPYDHLLEMKNTNAGRPITFTFPWK